MKYALVALCLLRAVQAPAQSPGGTVETAVILESLKTPEVCKGDAMLKIQAVLLNTSQQEIWINPEEFRSSTGTYSALIDTETLQYRQGGIGVAMDRAGHEIDWNVAVPSGGFYQKELSIPLIGEFFMKSGYYEANLTTSALTRDQGTVTSQYKFIFQIRACS